MCAHMCVVLQRHGENRHTTWTACERQWKTDCGQLNVSVRSSFTAQWSNVQTSSSATNWGKLQRRRVKCWCRCIGEQPWAENEFTNGSNAFAKGRKRLRISHVRVGHRQAEPQKWSRNCDKCWGKIGDVHLDWLRRNWTLGLTRRGAQHRPQWIGYAEDLLLICAAQAHRWAESKTDGNFWRLHFHVWPGSIASGKYRHGKWDLVLPVRTGIKTAIDDVVFTDFAATCKNPRSKQCWSPSSTTKASSIRNSFLQVKMLMRHFIRQFEPIATVYPAGSSIVTQDCKMDAAPR